MTWEEEYQNEWGAAIGPWPSDSGLPPAGFRWHFLPGKPLPVTDFEMSRRRRSQPQPRPNWIRLYDNHFELYSDCPRGQWIRCRLVARDGFWLDTTRGEPLLIPFTHAADVRASDPPPEMCFTLPDDIAGSWDDDMEE